MKSDYNWLEKWKDLFIGLENNEVLELGCGNGLDSEIISNWGVTLTSIDIDENVIKNNKSKLPNVNFIKLNFAEKLPFENGRFSVVLASLSLHYFSWECTKMIFNELYRVTQDDAAIICRVNSDRDINYGAVGYSEIEPGLFNVKGNEKRFFKEVDIIHLMGDLWDIEDISQKEIDRYEKPKNIWEFKANKCITRHSTRAPKSGAG